MKAGPVIGAVVAIGAALAVIILLRTSGPEGTGVGVKQAEAARCEKGSSDCLPKLTFVNTEGEAITPEQLDGKVVMINFWATWCHPCQSEVPNLTRAYQKYKQKGFVLFGIMTDDVDNPGLERFAKAHHLDYPVIRVDGSLLEAFGYPDRLPTTFIYDRHGKLRVNRLGALRDADLEQILPGLLDEQI